MDARLDVRVLSGAMAKLLLVFLLDAQTLTLEELSNRSGVRDLKTLRLACKALTQLDGLLVAQRGPHGRESWQSSAALLGQFPRQNGPEQAESPSCAAQVGGNPRTARSLIKIDETDISEIAEIQDCDKHALLDNAALLFGKPVTWHANFANQPALELLAWLAQAYQAWLAKKLDRPWGLVYKGLLGKLARAQADRQYRADPLAFLPEAYLSACGLAQAAQPEPEEAGLPEQAMPARECAPPMDSALQAHIQPAWEALVRQLQTEMSRAAFETWLAPCAPLGWDAGRGCLSLSTSGPEAAAWLESRLKSRMQRELCGMLNCAVTLEFVPDPQAQPEPY